MSVKYGKTSQNAIAAMSVLAENYNDGALPTFLNSSEIAKCRDLPKPIIAKILTVLSRANLLRGAPGPGGGYALSRPPDQISLYEIVQLFEKEGINVLCPFGPNWCGVGEPCPIHDQLFGLDDQYMEFLQKTYLEVFAKGRVKVKV